MVSTLPLTIKIGLNPELFEVIGLEITWHGLLTALGVVVGTLTINLGFVSYHTIFLDAAPIGWLIAASSALIALGFGLSARFPKSLVLRVLVSATAIGLGIASSWQMALVTFMTPVFFYEINNTHTPSINFKV